ncbi:MAG TPA: hypothetical protein VGE21_14805 [Flavobacteriales bacterium]
MTRTLLLLLAFLLFGPVVAQNTIAFQGFEGGTACPDWGYTGGEVNTTLAESGLRSNRVGNVGGSTTITLDPVNVSTYANVQLSISHAVQCGGGPGMDWGSGHEGAVIEVRYNGGAWSAVGRITGGNDHCYSWGSQGGNPSTGCGFTMPNPLVVAVPNGTATVEVRAYSTNLNSCPNTVPNLFNRSDEGFYIDNVRLTTSSPVVTPASGAVIWTGAQGTDWFDCRNWNPTVVPGPGWDVTIDQSATNHCVIGSTTATPLAASCASLTLASTGANRRLTISNNRSLTVVGNTIVQRTSATADSIVFLVQAGQFTTTGLAISGTGAVFRNNTASNTVQVNGNFSVAGSGLAHLNGSTIGIGGNIDNNVSPSSFRRSTTTNVILNGSADQTIGTSGFTDTYPRLTVMKSGGDVYLDDAIEIATSGVLDLQQGRIFTPGSTSAMPKLTVKPSATVLNASDASFVHGIMRKQGNTPFRFPVGKGNVMRPVALVGPLGGSNLPTQHYTAEYFHSDPQLVFGSSREATLDHISQCEYWELSRTGGSTTPIVQLTWNDPTSCGVDQPLTLSVARWNNATSTWMDRGNSDVIITGSSGSVDSWVAESTFGYWTLASTTSMNPLPIELLSFTATANGPAVDLAWSTATEHDNAYFTVERSADAMAFVDLLQRPGSGNSTVRIDYSDVDPAPLSGWSYYRLKQTDVNGNSTRSATVPVYIERPTNISVAVDADRILVRHGLTNGRYEVIDASGRTIATGTAGSGVFDLPAPMAHGAYVLRITSADAEERVRFAY